MLTQDVAYDLLTVMFSSPNLKEVAYEIQIFEDSIRVLVEMWWIFGFREEREVSALVERPLASQEGLCCTE
jgi:hypothetical protein